jgi:hypothetical protein
MGSALPARRGGRLACKCQSGLDFWRCAETVFRRIRNSSGISCVQKSSRWRDALASTRDARHGGQAVRYPSKLLNILRPRLLLAARCDRQLRMHEASRR